MKKLAITLSTLFFLAPTQAEPFKPQSLLEGIKETKLIFDCGHPDAEIIFKARERYTKEHTVSEDGEIIEMKSIDVCAGTDLFPAGDYCVEALCLIKETTPTIPPAGVQQNNVNQLKLKAPSLDNLF